MSHGQHTFDECSERIMLNIKIFIGNPHVHSLQKTNKSHLAYRHSKKKSSETKQRKNSAKGIEVILNATHDSKKKK